MIETGDPVIRIHIPPFGKMAPELIDKTLEETKKFAKEHFPDFDIHDLPEKSSLQRALKQHYLNGKTIYEMEGFLKNNISRYL